MPRYDAAHLRKRNMQLVFREFRGGECLYGNEIARKTDISAPTVLKIIDFLLENRLIAEQEAAGTGVGRKPKLLSVDRQGHFSIGAVYEGEYLMLGLVDLNGDLQNFMQVKCGRDFEASLTQNVDRMLEISKRDARDLAGIGIGIPCIYAAASREITAPLLGIDRPRYFGDTVDAVAEKYGAGGVVDRSRLHT